MGTLHVRNCTIWDVHYWRQTAGGNAFAGPGQEGTLDCSTTYTLGVKRLNVLPDGKNYRSAVNKNGIYYVVWNAAEGELQILSEEQANTYPVTPDNKYLTKWISKLPDWMSSLDGSYTLDRYTIPGTHDSGTGKLSAGFSNTQNFGIGTQLEDGVRFLDIRLDRKFPVVSPLPLPPYPITEGDELVVKHSCDDCDLSFVDVLNTCKSFLASHSDETILMLVNKSGCYSKNIAAKFMEYLNRKEYKNLFYLAEKMPKLDEVRGKIVLLRRFEIETPVVLGLDLSVGWEKDKTFTLITPQGQCFEIEDQYKEHDTNEKVVDVYNNLDNAMKNPADDVMYITYNSIATNGFHTPYQYAWGGNGVKPAMNPKLEEYLKEHPGNLRFGVVVLDFYNNQGSQNQNVEMLVKANDGMRK